LNYNEYRKFIDDFIKGEVGLDPEFFLAEALAQCLYRPMVIISTLDRHKDKPIKKFNRESTKPPLIYGVVKRDGHEIFIPFFYNKNLVFRLDQLKGKVQIIGYSAKTIPEALKTRPILDLESYAVVVSLHSLQRFVSGVKVTLLTDSRVLFYLLSSTVHNSSVKIKRWCLKIIYDFPYVVLRFVRTTENLADFLTRQGMPAGDLGRVNIKEITVRDLGMKLPKETFTLTEWVDFVDAHPEYLTINTPKHLTPKAVIMALERGIDNLTEFTTPLMILRDKLSRENFVLKQRIERTDLYNNCVASPDFTFEEVKGTETLKYKLVGGLIVRDCEPQKVVVPPSLIGPLLAHTHLFGHKGLT
jgi:hypothetical protein